MSNIRDCYGAMDAADANAPISVLIAVTVGRAIASIGVKNVV